MFFGLSVWADIRDEIKSSTPHLLKVALPNLDTQIDGEEGGLRSPIKDGNRDWAPTYKRSGNNGLNPYDAVTHHFGLDFDRDHGGNPAPSDLLDKYEERIFGCDIPGVMSLYSTGGVNNHTYIFPADPPRYPGMTVPEMRRAHALHGLNAAWQLLNHPQIDLPELFPYIDSNQILWNHSVDATEDSFKPICDNEGKFPYDQTIASEVEKRKPTRPWKEFKALEWADTQLRFLETASKYGACAPDGGGTLYNVHWGAILKACEELGLPAPFAMGREPTDLSQPNGAVFPLPHDAILLVLYNRNHITSGGRLTANGNHCAVVNPSLHIDSLRVVFEARRAGRDKWHVDESHLPYLCKLCGIPDPPRPGRISLTMHGDDLHVSVPANRRGDDQLETAEPWFYERKRWHAYIPIDAKDEPETELSDKQFLGIWDSCVRYTTPEGWYVNYGNTEGFRQASQGSTTNFVINKVGPKAAPGVLHRINSHPWIDRGTPGAEVDLPGRVWNRTGARLAFPPEEGEFPFIRSTLDHIGSWLTQVVRISPWCQQHGISTGGEYLLDWVCSLMSDPEQPLPHLAFWGLGFGLKSTFRKMLQTMYQDTVGVVGLEDTLRCERGFNKDLDGAVCGYVDDFNIAKYPIAHQRFKSWVNNNYLDIHPKFGHKYRVRNYLHMVTAVNELKFIFREEHDRRTVAIYVPKYFGVKMLDSEVEAKFIEEGPALTNYALNVWQRRDHDSSNKLQHYLPVMMTPVKSVLCRSVDEDPNKEDAYRLMRIQNTLESIKQSGQRVFRPSDLDEFTGMRLRGPIRPVEAECERSLSCLGRKEVCKAFRESGCDYDYTRTLAHQFGLSFEHVTIPNGRQSEYRFADCDPVFPNEE